MAAPPRPPSRGKLLDSNTSRPRPLGEGVRPGSSPRVMLSPLKPPNSQGFAGSGSDSPDDKEYIAQLKREIRLLANKVSEYSAAVDTDRRMGDSSSLLRRPLTPGSANRPGTSGGQASVGHLAGNIDTFIEKASAGKGSEQVKSALLELLLTLLEDAQRSTLMLTEKRAPAGCTVPAASSVAGRMGSRVPVTEALMERALQLHGAVRPAEEAERTRPTTGSRPQGSDSTSGLSPDLVATLLMRLADLHEHYGAIADGKRDAGETLGGKLLDDLESSLSTLTSACLQPSHSKVAHAASRVQGEARNANFAISTALAMGGSAESTGVEEQLQMQLEKAKGELAIVRKEEEATKTKTAVEVETLNRRLSEKEGEVKALQGQLRSASRSSAQQKEEEEAVAKDLLSAAKTTALEAANSDLSNEVKQLKAQLAHAKAVSIAGASQHDCADSTAAVASRLQPHPPLHLPSVFCLPPSSCIRPYRFVSVVIPTNTPCLVAPSLAKAPRVLGPLLFPNPFPITL